MQNGNTVILKTNNFRIIKANDFIDWLQGGVPISKNTNQKAIIRNIFRHFYDSKLASLVSRMSCHDDELIIIRSNLMTIISDKLEKTNVNLTMVEINSDDINLKVEFHNILASLYRKFLEEQQSN